MSNPDDAAALDEFPGEEEVTTPTEIVDTAEIEKQVVTACNEMEFDDNGKWKVPQGTSPEMQVAINAERRRRDTQSSYSKSQQALKAAELKTNKLAEKLESKIKPNITVEQAEELEDLKENNPEAWRDKLNELETAAKAKHDEEMQEVDATSGQAAELERRKLVLEEFVAANPELAINDHVFTNDLPQRITGKLSEGEVTFEEFLDEAKEFLTKGKKVATANEEVEPNLGKSGGTSSPAVDAVDKDIIESYKTEIF